MEGQGRRFRSGFGFHPDLCFDLENETAGTTLGNLESGRRKHGALRGVANEIRHDEKTVEVKDRGGKVKRMIKVMGQLKT